MKTSFSTATMTDKQNAAEQLGLIASNQLFMVICDYRRDSVLPDRDETLGHVYEAKMLIGDNEHEQPSLWFTDLGGDLRLTLATEIENHANAMLEVASALRQHYHDEEGGAS